MTTRSMAGVLLAVLVVGVLSAAGAVTYTVGPTGKDFTTIQAAIDFAETNNTPAQDFVIDCYAGGNLGPVTLATGAGGFATVPESITIKAAAGNLHVGQCDRSGAWVLCSAHGITIASTFAAMHNLIVDGLTFVLTNDNYAVMFSNYGAATNTIRNCMAFAEGATGGGGFVYDDDYGSLVYFRNNGLVGRGTVLQGIIALGTVYADNNSLLSQQAFFNDGGTMHCRNNYAGVPPVIGASYYQVTAGTNNIASDSRTPDAGSGNVTNKAAVNQFVSTNLNLNLKAGADCLDAGITIGEFNTDALGIPRPQRVAWDVGALELPPANPARPRPAIMVGGSW